ncbi:hypothetical protein AB0J38_37755 [Streptomyces sp. NPDC050095]|uniref:hypothetical protein n=1 Tax=unclassified Streptomyces TaxID=2593676 RepID=UPI0034189C23
MANDRQNTGDLTARFRSVVDALAEASATRPRIVREPGSLRVEIDVTPAVTARWKEILDVLGRGDTFGLTDTAHGKVAWLRVTDGDDDGAS